MTDLFLRRPVLALVVSLLILLAGLRGLAGLPVQQFPHTVSATIQVQTTYYGADAETVAGFLTTPIENAVSQVEGVDTLVSQSQTSTSIVTLSLRLNQDPERAMTQVQAYVNGITNQLPPGAQTPVITVASTTGEAVDISVASAVLPPEAVSDYASRVVQPQLQAVPGVQNVMNQSQTNLSMRVWLDARALARYGMTAADVAAALGANQYVTGVGTTLGGMTYVNLAITSGLHTEAEFRALVLRRDGAALVRLGDVADVRYGPEIDNVRVADEHGPISFLAITTIPGANLLTVARGVHEVIARLQKDPPPGIVIGIVNDGSRYVRASLDEVTRSLVESLAIVACVIFLFLGSFRSVMIPLVTIPLSVIGTFALMAAMGFSINELTLLALVLAIGLVVDDAIIVVENVNRHLADGMRPVAASARAARELAVPIVAMTAVLIAAFVPVGLQSGLTGALFTEFAFTLACSVTVSGLLALALSPTMCAVLLRPHHDGAWLVRAADAALHVMQRAYGAALARLLDAWPLVALVALLLIPASVLMFQRSAHELAPRENGNWLLIGGQVPPNAALDQLRLFDAKIVEAIRAQPDIVSYWIVDQPGTVTDGVVLAPAGSRRRSSTEVAAALQDALWHVAGIQLAVFQTPSLPGSQGMPIQFVIKGTGSIDALADVGDRMLLAARRSGRFAYIEKDLKLDQPQTTIVLDRARIAELGLKVSDVGNTLNWLLAGSYVNYFSLAGRSYKVEPLVTRAQRLDAAQILGYPIANVGGVPIPLSAVAHLEDSVVAEQIPHFAELLATTLQGIPAPGVSTAEAYAELRSLAARILPAGYATDTAGPLREYLAEQGSFVPVFGFALAIIFLALAALFGSFRDPIVILMSVPMSLAGALFFVWLGVGGATLNLFSEVGLVTLAGLISKHGILIVEVANAGQQAGLGKRAAIERAASLRLRPILMTTAAMVLGVMPLVFATGAGAGARFAMGLVIAGGLSVGTLFTLFVVPAVYMGVAARHRPGEAAGLTGEALRSNRT